MNEKYILFVDTLGRLLLGKEGNKSDDPTVISIKNPGIVHAIHKENGGMQITIIPIVFREFLADRDTPTYFEYARSSISIAQNTTLDARIAGQYEQMFSTLNGVVNVPRLADTPTPTPAPVPAKASTAPVIKLFDD